ncbi:MAG: hypothetical protein FJ014_13640 [Chloroflexi bacterium]|nr:hypothetical protein [Chloroflexota bacterium]
MRSRFFYLGSVYLQARAGRGDLCYGAPRPHSYRNRLTDENRGPCRNQYSHLTGATRDGYANAACPTADGYADTAYPTPYIYTNEPATNRCTGPHSDAYPSPSQAFGHEFTRIQHAGLPVVASRGSRP